MQLFSSAKPKKKNRYGLQTIFLTVFAAFCFYVLFFHTEIIEEKATEYSLHTINSIYGAEIDEYAKKYNLPPEYFKALIMLETSGRKKIPSRYEPHVFEELKAVQQKKRRKYEHVTRRNIRDANDDALRNLASSWGPFQIMGYKCLELNITVAELRGENSIKHGIFWINRNYGKLLQKNRFKDAFHFHNTGRLFPQNGQSLTHDPDYVLNGLKYMEFFKNNPD